MKRIWVAEFAANIQRHFRESKRKERPVSLDALGILRSGENSICTANANLAVALMRAKGIACRSVAVVPPIAQRLEMHRVVEFLDDQKWQVFDPSSLQPDLPARYWQHIIMAKTTIADEHLAMRPRMGAMVGTPYGQELEMLNAGISFWGQDFFWTQAQPVAEFEPSAEAIRLATERWQSFLETGRLTMGQRRAASAKSSEELIQALRTE